MKVSILQYLFLLLTSFLLFEKAESAWRSSPVLASDSRISKNRYAFVSKWRRKPKAIIQATKQKEGEEVSSSVKERSIEITSEVELPFSAEVAYDAYSNLSRQPSWSSWLYSVEYLNDSKELTKWKMRFLGLTYSWTAVQVANERPHTIKWRSTSGLQNFGTVRFLQENPAKPTIMKMKMTFVPPRAVSSLFRRSAGFQNFVKEKMITSSMTTFREVVSNVDLKKNIEEDPSI